MVRTLLITLIFFPKISFAAAVAPIVIGAAISGAVAASWTVFAASIVLGFISYAMTPKLKKPSFGNDSSTTTVRQSDLSRLVIYGHTRVTRGYAQIESVETNKKLHIIVMLCDGPLRAINEVWMDEYSIPDDWIDDEGNVTDGRYKGKLVIRRHLGDVNQNADSLAVQNIPGWTDKHRLQGIAYLYMILTKDQDVYPNGVPNISAIVEGASLYDPRVSAPRWSTNMAVYAYDFIRNDRYGFGAFEDDVDEANISAQANICDEIVDTDGTSYVVKTVTPSTDLFTLNGEMLPYEYGDRVRFSSDGTLPGGISAGTDYYVIPYQMRRTPRFRVASSLSNAMAKTAIDITSAGSGEIKVIKNGEPRYHGGGTIDNETPLSETLSNLVSCMGGRAINVAGFWTLLAGAWRTPAVEYNINDIRGSGIKMQNASSMSDNYNIVKGLYFSSVNYYQASDYPSAFYQEFITADGGLESPRELNLPFCTRPTTAQRIAKMELFRGRQSITFQADFSLKGMRVQTGDNIKLTIDRYGWEQKAFEITEFGFRNDNGALYTTMTLRETAQEIFDWSQGEAINYDPAPNSNLPNPFDVMAPSGVSYSSRAIDTVNGDSVFTLTLAWMEHPDAFVREFGDFEIQFKLESESEWRPSFFVDGQLTATDVVNSSVNVPYDLRIRARNNLGVRSPWVSIFGAVVGSSGGVGVTNDWGSTSVVPADNTLDWGSTATVPADNFEDWGFTV